MSAQPLPLPVPSGPAPAATGRPLPGTQPTVTPVTPAPAPEPAPAPPVELRHMTIASKVRAFGDVVAIAPASKSAGSSFIAYVELANWPTRPAAGGKVTALVRYDVRILDADGLPAASFGPFTASHTAPPPVVDNFVARVVKVPATLPPGRYAVEIDATDPETGARARTTAALEVTAAPPTR